jgi:hypothetical protein
MNLNVGVTHGVSRANAVPHGKDQAEDIIIDDLVQRVIHRSTQPLLLEFQLSCNCFHTASIAVCVAHAPARYLVETHHGCCRTSS